MDPRYVRLPKGSWDSLGHQCFLTICVLGKYPSLHGLVKTDSCFTTNDNACFTSQVGTSHLGRGHFPFHLEGPLNGNLLQGFCGTPHNEF